MYLHFSTVSPKIPKCGVLANRFDSEQASAWSYQRSWVHMLSVASRGCVWEIDVWVLPAFSLSVFRYIRNTVHMDYFHKVRTSFLVLECGSSFAVYDRKLSDFIKTSYKTRSYRFETTWGSVINDIICIFGVNYPWTTFTVISWDCLWRKKVHNIFFGGVTYTFNYYLFSAIYGWFRTVREAMAVFQNTVSCLKSIFKL